MKNEKEHKSSGWAVQAFFHLLAWVCIFAAPLLFHGYNESFAWSRYLHGSLFPLSLCVLFYVNYLWLVPALIPRKRYTAFVLYNLAVYALLALLREPVARWLLPPEAGWQFPPAHMPPPRWAFVLRDLLTYVFATGVAVMLRLSMQWRKAEQGRREAELGRAEAELQNLKNQINPHFLLNTLNNIYALTAFDGEKAREAILELSRLLRYVLYENQAPLVSLTKEAGFLRSYVELMRLRVGKEVDIRVDIDLPPDDRTCVAPLIFISLVENAFKHGISPTEPSFVHISLSVTSGEIRFTTTNSNYPKSQADKAGSGIGLKQVESRLRLAYPERHTWHHGVTDDGKVYLSSILIYSSKEQPI